MDLKINKLPAPTWNWLRVNDINIEVPSEVQEIAPKSYTAHKEIDTSRTDFSSIGLDNIKLGTGEEFKTYLDNQRHDATIYKVARDTTIKEPLRLTIDYSSDTAAVSKLGIQLLENSKLTVVITYAGAKSFGACDIRFELKDNASLTLVELFQFDGAKQFIDSIGGVAGKAARFDLIQIINGTGNLNLGCQVDLKGDGSALNINTGYVVKNEDRLDINYIASHHGKKSDSRINVGGVLKDNATKTFRGTIDFIRGSKSATGDEREEVLLLSDRVHNNTVPLILCEEEDVEGAHGASIGRISDDILYYFKSRGISEEQVIELMSKAKLDAVINKIPDDATRQSLLKENEDE